MDAITLLEQQHEEVMQMFSELEDSKRTSERTATFKKLQRSLLAHMLIEEEIFYPAVVSHTSEGEPIAEGYEEHSGARVALARCARAVRQEDLFQVRIGVLKEMIAHHVKEEREAILPKAREAMPKDDLEALGRDMETRFDAAMRSTSVAGDLNRKTTSRTLHALDA